MAQQAETVHGDDALGHVVTERHRLRLKIRAAAPIRPK